MSLYQQCLSKNYNWQGCLWEVHGGTFVHYLREPRIFDKWNQPRPKGVGFTRDEARQSPMKDVLSCTWLQKTHLPNSSIRGSACNKGIYQRSFGRKINHRCILGSERSLFDHRDDLSDLGMYTRHILVHRKGQSCLGCQIKRYYNKYG